MTQATQQIDVAAIMAQMQQMRDLIEQQSKREAAMTAELERIRNHHSGGKWPEHGAEVIAAKHVDAQPASGSRKARSAYLSPPALEVHAEGMSTKSTVRITSNYCPALLDLLKSGKLETLLLEVQASHERYLKDKAEGESKGVYGR